MSFYILILKKMNNNPGRTLFFIYLFEHTRESRTRFHIAQSNI